ncbi:hypothetical protein CYLTODRAFT_446830 [Cylindrobasidium torrendii FP15055 ss-10]|uniref:Uncharacterized protein n=1 Tax=Cylindrobasidium torrendii FP15055 ss-10 TaxID=1314674 RepID=A0A0D7AYV2_9AGAR|nr:hypothetical protein CYLTODRAFT_446830 [Cylindrobasidium torrendii FP15055 ss-10]
MNSTAALSTPNPGGSLPRQTYSRTAKREDTDYYPKDTPIEDVMRVTEVTPERLATFTELASKMVLCVGEAVRKASPEGDNCLDTGTPNLHGRNNLVHTVPRHGDEPVTLRAGDDMRSCGRSIYVDSYSNVFFLDLGPHNDYDANLWTFRPLKDVCDDIVSIIERNVRLPLNSPDRIDVWDDGVCIGTRAGDESRPPIKSHTALGSHFVRFMRALRYKKIVGELNTCDSISPAELKWSRRLLKRVTDVGWFDPMDDNERTFLFAKRVLNPSNTDQLRRLTGRSVKGDKLGRSLISSVKLSERDTSYLVDVLLPDYGTPSAPARIDRFILDKLSPPEDDTEPVEDIPSDKLISPAFKSSENIGDTAPTNPLPLKSTASKTATAREAAPSVKFTARALGHTTTAPINHNTRTLTGSNTLVASQTASTHATRVPKRNRESDAADNRTIKKGKTVVDAHESSSPGPFVGSSPENSTADSPPLANSFKAMLRSKEDALKDRRVAALTKGQQAVTTRRSAAPGVAQSRPPPPAAPTKDKPSNASVVPKSGFAFKMPASKTVPSSNALLQAPASAKPSQAKSTQPVPPSQSVARKASQPTLRPPSTSRIPGPSTSKIPAPSAASGSRRVIDRMKPKPQPKPKPPKA